MSANRPAAHSDADSTSPQLRPPPPGRPVLPMAPAGPASSRRLEGITTVKPLQLLAAALTDCCATANPGRHRCQRSRRRRRRRMEKGDEKKRRRKKPYRFLLTVQNEPGFYAISPKRSCRETGISFKSTKMMVASGLIFEFWRLLSPDNSFVYIAVASCKS